MDALTKQYQSLGGSLSNNAIPTSYIDPTTNETRSMTPQEAVTRLQNLNASKGGIANTFPTSATTTNQTNTMSSTDYATQQAAEVARQAAIKEKARQDSIKSQGQQLVNSGAGSSAVNNFYSSLGASDQGLVSGILGHNIIQGYQAPNSNVQQTVINPGSIVSNQTGGTSQQPTTPAPYKAGDLTNFLNGGTGGASPDFATLNALAQSFGIQGYQNNPTYNSQLLSKLQALKASNTSNGNTSTSVNTDNSTTAPYTLDNNTPITLGSGNSGGFSSSILNNGITTNDVMGQQQNYESMYNGYLKQQADALAALNQTKATELQGQANIMYGLNGAGGHDASLQGLEQQQFDRQMAFQTVPAQIALSNAQTALSLFKQSPQYLTETQARDTAFNLLQSYADLPIQYDPSRSAQANLIAIRGALPKSAKYQASLVNYAGYTTPDGVFHLFNKKDPNLIPDSTTTPTPSNPITPAGIYVGTSGSSISAPAPIVDHPTTKPQINFVENFNTGVIGTAKNALNTAVGHLFEADQLFAQLGNGDNTVLNGIKNSYKNVTGNNAASNYETAQTLASNELSSAYGGDAQGDRNKLAQFGGSSQSPSQHTGYVQTSTQLLASKIGAIAEQYRGAFGHYPPSMDSLLSPLNQVKLSAFTKTNLSGIVPGVGVSPSTQGLINTAQIVGGKVYLPDAQGNYQPTE